VSPAAAVVPAGGEQAVTARVAGKQRREASSKWRPAISGSVRISQQLVVELGRRSAVTGSREERRMGVHVHAVRSSHQSSTRSPGTPGPPGFLVVDLRALHPQSHGSAAASACRAAAQYSTSAAARRCPPARIWARRAHAPPPRPTARAGPELLVEQLTRVGETREPETGILRPRAVTMVSLRFLRRRDQVQTADARQVRRRT